MRVFIAGATGILGRRVVRLLIANGYQVVGLSRSTRNSDWLDEQGVFPRQGDLFDLEQICKISTDCDVTLHLATAIPTKSRITARDWALNDRIRREGTENLARAALQNKHEFYLQQSVALLYGDRQGDWVDESTPLPDKQVDIVQSAVDMEGIVRQAEDDGLPATILRFGRFYSHDSSHTRALFQMAQKGLFPVVGKGDYYWHLINVDDAASAIIQALEKRQVCIHRTFNVCDDEPVLFSTYLGFVTGLLGARSPVYIPVWLAKLMLGASMVEALTASVRCRNERFKEQTGWQPDYPTYRAGVAAELRRWREDQTSPSYTSTHRPSSKPTTR